MGKFQDGATHVILTVTTTTLFVGAKMDLATMSATPSTTMVTPTVKATSLIF